MGSSQDSDVVSASDEQGFFVEIFGRRFRRPDASELVEKLLVALQDDLFSRGLLAGRRAALRDIFGALEPFATESFGAKNAGPARFAPGVNAERLDRFLQATSGQLRKGEPPKHKDETPTPPRLGAPLIPPAEPRESAERAPWGKPEFLREPAQVERVQPPLATEIRENAASYSAGAFPSRSDDPRATAQVAAYVKRRAMAWWAKAKVDEFEPAVRAEARSIAAELFELADELRRGEHLREGEIADE